MKFDELKLIIRPATLDDIDFVVTAIIEAEKSFTDKIGPANYFELSENDYRRYIKLMLQEEIDGCELSISSYVVAEYEGNVISCRGGWLEGDNEAHNSSSILKSNLFAYFVPIDNLQKGIDKYDIVKDIMIERSMGAYQIENSYTIPEFRGLHITTKLDEYHIKNAIQKGCHTMQVHVCLDNEKSIKACERSGFKIVKIFKSSDKRITDYYPSDTMVLMEKYI